MPKLPLNQQLDAAIDAMLQARAQKIAADSASGPEAARFYGPGLREQSVREAAAALPERIGQLLAIAGDLAALPREEFRTNLQAELQRRASMGTAQPAAETRPEIPRVPP